MKRPEARDQESIVSQLPATNYLVTAAEHDLQLFRHAEQRADRVVGGCGYGRERQLHLRFVEPADCGGNHEQNRPDLGRLVQLR